MNLKPIRVRRLKQLQAERGAQGPVELGRLIGRKANQTSDLLSGRTSFGEKVARSIEERVGLPNGWLDRFDDPAAGALEVDPSPLPAWASVPLLQAGAASELSGSEVALAGPLNLSSAWIASLGVGSATSLRYMQVVDDLMEPTLACTDVLLVDTSVHDCRRDGVYVLWAHNQILVRRVRTRLDGKLEVSADSAAVKSSDLVEPRDLHVLGRAAWSWHGRKL